MADSRGGWLFGLPAGTKWRNLTANNTLLKQAPFGNLPGLQKAAAGSAFGMNAQEAHKRIEDQKRQRIKGVEEQET